MTIVASAEINSFHPSKDQICGKGRDLNLGCNAIQGREIVEAKQRPFSAIGRLNYAGFNLKKHCTGTLIAPNIVLTAAHCLFVKKIGRWLKPEEIVFVAGYERSEYLDFSKVKRYKIDNGVRRRKSDKIEPLSKDWAILELHKSIGDTAGYLEISETIPSSFSIFGYPALRPHALSADRDCVESPSKRANSDKLLLHKCAIMSGDSGGPVLARKEDKLKLIAINTAAFIDSDYNALTAISVPIAEIPISRTLKDWGYE